MVVNQDLTCVLAQLCTSDPHVPPTARLLFFLFFFFGFFIFILQCLCVSDSKMTEHPTKEKEVLEIFEEVSVRRREAEIVSVFFSFSFSGFDRCKRAMFKRNYFYNQVRFRIFKKLCELIRSNVFLFFFFFFFSFFFTLNQLTQQMFYRHFAGIWSFWLDSEEYTWCVHVWMGTMEEKNGPAFFPDQNILFIWLLFSCTSL